jgi:hypothetical protein
MEMTDFNESRIIALIEEEYKRHPLAGYIDFYKLFFQGTFGPGHFVESASSARKWLEEELLGDTTPYGVQDIGYHSNFLRVGIEVIRDGIISLDKYLELFITTACAPVEYAKEWVIEWKLIDVILTSRIVFDETERASLLKRLTEGTFLCSHTVRYRDTYHPHYRVLRADLWQEAIMR